MSDIHIHNAIQRDIHKYTHIHTHDACLIYTHNAIQKDINIHTHTHDACLIYTYTIEYYSIIKSMK